MRSTTEERNHARPWPARAPVPADEPPADEPAAPEREAQAEPGAEPPPTEVGTAPGPAAGEEGGDAPTGAAGDAPTGADDAPTGADDAKHGVDDDDGGGGGGKDGGDDGPVAPPGPRRRRALVVAGVLALVLVLVAVAVSPLSPVSPFRPRRDEHARVPLPDGGVRVTTTTSPEATGPKFPDAGPAPVTPLTTLPPAPGAPAPGESPVPGAAPAPPPPDVPTPAPIEGAGYGLSFHDEFDGPTANANVWQTAPFGGALPPTTSDGHLTIRTTAANGYNWGHVASSGPRGDGEPSYPFMQAWQEGYFEARLRYTDNAWSWPAFWLFSRSKSEAWPGEDCSELTSEWDVMENGIPNVSGDRPASRWYYTALHRNTSNNTDGGYCDTPDEQRKFGTEVPGTNLADWHTWGASWTADELCTYLDGVRLQCMEPYDSTAQAMQLVFTIQYLRRCDGCGERPPSLEMAVDWVRVWQR